MLPQKMRNAHHISSQHTKSSHDLLELIQSLCIISHRTLCNEENGLAAFRTLLSIAGWTNGSSIALINIIGFSIPDQ